MITIGRFFDRTYLVFMVGMSFFVMYLNWHALHNVAALHYYEHFCVLIKNSFVLENLITFPMWGYGWLMLITQNKLGLLCMQMGFALFALYYVIKILEKDSIFTPAVIRMLKVCMIFSLPWYAFHAIRWPNSISATLTLLSITLLYKALITKNKMWIYSLCSAVSLGGALHFRSDYYLMPIVLVMLIVIMERNWKSIFQMSVWLLGVYACLVPWALYTKKVCDHYLLTSTNSGHVLFVGLGNDPDNRWGITTDDADPLMHKLVNEHFQTSDHSTLDYEADIFLKKTFLSFVADYPKDYAKKCFYAFKASLVGGFYPGEFLMTEQGEIDPTGGLRVRYLMIKLLREPRFLMEHFSDMVRLFAHTFLYFISKYVLILSYLLLPVTLVHAVTKKHSLFIFLMLAAIIYQTMLNTFCSFLPSYTSNLYIFYLWNAIFGISLLYNTIYSFCKRRKTLTVNASIL